MKKTIALLLGLLSLAAKPQPTGWGVERHNGNWKFTVTSAAGTGGDVATMPLTYSTLSTFLAKDNAVDLRGKSISFTGYFNSTGSAWLDWYGNGYPDSNPCQSTPATVQVYISTRTGPYNLSTSSSESGQSDYWWCPTAVVINENSTISVTVPTDPVRWGNGLGKRGDNPDYAAAFQSALANSKRQGLSFNGGCFFDWGIFKRGTGDVTFHLTSFSIQ